MKSKVPLILITVLFLSACAPKAAPTPSGTLPPFATENPATVSTQVPSLASTIEPSATPTMEGTLSSTPESTTGAPVLSGEAEIEIEDFAFNPAKVTIAAGTTIKWSNKDDSTHTVVADDGSWNSDALNKGDDFFFTFSQPGTYTYHCSLHSSMKGTIIVVSP